MASESVAERDTSFDPRRAWIIEDASAALQIYIYPSQDFLKQTLTLCSRFNVNAIIEMVISETTHVTFFS